jgi:hypothetical protein
MALSCSEFCDQDSACTNGQCNLYSNLCVTSGQVTGPGGVGAACTGSKDCKSGGCFEGACTSRCDARSQRCPDGAVCVQVPSGGDVGICSLPCASDHDCIGTGVPVCTSFPEGGKFCFFSI